MAVGKLSLTLGLFFVALFCVSDTAGLCRKGWTQSGQKCFLLVVKHLFDWYGAQGVCEILGANLAVPKSRTENQAIASLLRAAQVKFAWIGVNDIEEEGQYREVKTNRPITYQNWNFPFASFREPNNDDTYTASGEDCGGMFSSGRWNDLDCEGFGLRAVCELPAQGH